MARVKNNKLTEGMSGQLNGQVVMKVYGKNTFFTKYPDMSKVKFSDKQKTEQSLFGEAILYAKSIINDPEKRAAFKASIEPGRRVYNAAISAYLKEHKSKNAGE